jgi:hypothetical protein
MGLFFIHLRRLKDPPSVPGSDWMSSDWNQFQVTGQTEWGWGVLTTSHLMIATDTVSGNAYFLENLLQWKLQKNYRVVILALLKKHSVYLCAVSAHQGYRRVKNSNEHIWNVCFISSVPLVFFPLMKVKDCNWRFVYNHAPILHPVYWLRLSSCYI